MATTTKARRNAVEEEEAPGSYHSGDEPAPMHGNYEDETDEEGQDLGPAAADAPGPSYEIDAAAEDEHLGDDVPADASAREIRLRQRLRDAEAQNQYHVETMAQVAEQHRELEHRYVTQRVTPHLAQPEDFHLFASHENLIDPNTGRLDDAKIDGECGRVLSARPGLGRARAGMPMVATVPGSAGVHGGPRVLDTTAQQLASGTGWEKVLRDAVDPVITHPGNLAT